MKICGHVSHPIEEERFRALIELSLDAIALVEPDGTVSRVSPSIVRVLGYTPEEFVEFKVFDAVHPDERQQAIERLADIVRQLGGSQTLVNRVRHKDGSWRWIETVFSNQLENPRVRAVVANFRDITDRRHIEVALREREEHFRLIVESAIDYAIFTLSLDGRITSWNVGAERILGYREEEILGRHVSIIFTPEDNAKGRAEFEMHGAVNEEHENDDRWHLKKGGIRFWANGMMMPLKDEAGGIKGYLKILRDRTEQKLARDALTSSEERLRIAADAARLGLWHYDLRPGTMIWDELCKEHFGLPPDAEVSFDRFFEQLRPEDREPTREALKLSIAEHKTFNKECRTVAPGGLDRWIRVIGHGCYDDSGECYRFDGVTIDVTDRKLAEEALRDADRRKDEFLAILAHELRNPLAAITNAVQLSLRSARDEELAWSKDVIARQAKNLARLLDDLLDVSRITREKIQLHKERIDLAPVITRAVESVRPLIEQKKHNLTLFIAQGYMGLLADQTRIEQVLVNLLTNAATYTKEGGHITLTAQHDGKVTVTVKDNGVGIPPDMLPRIFDLFVQVDRTIDRSLGGLGIGLTLVKKIVEMHGGTVTAASEGTGKGSEFTVELPAVAEPTKDLLPSQPSPAAQAPAGLHVLVADDNPDTAAGLTKLLQASGYRVTTAGDGLEALEAARAERPEVILMDIGLPGMDGYRIAEQLRKEKGCENAVLIAISGYGQEQDRRRSIEAGFDYHLVKPVDYQRLLSFLARPKSITRDKLEH
jgi:PAS domain S-box-containing protein